MEGTFGGSCPHCQERRTFRIVGHGSVFADEHLAGCGQCGLGMLVRVVPTDSGPNIVGTRPHEPPILRHQTTELPGGIAADLLEAGRCYSFLAYRGAGLLARRAVEQAVVMLGVPTSEKTLHQKLQWSFGQGRLPADVATAARTIREVGNASAHGSSAVRQDEAEAAVRAALSVVAALLR